jgi:hypothetical protein
MIDYTAIADYCAANGWTDPQIAFGVMSVETETQTVDIETRDILAYISLVDKRLAIEESTATAAKKARLAFIDFPSFRITENAAYLARLTAIIDELVTEGLLDATDKAAILGLGETTKQKWPGLKRGHVDNALEWREAGEI